MSSTFFDTLMRSGYARGILLALISAVVFLCGLGTDALIDYDEAAYGMVLEDTREAGQFASLSTSGRNWFDKPPLYFWMAEGFAQVGLPPEWHMRLPSALAGIGSVIFVYLIILYATRRPLAAFLGGLILLSTGAFIEAGRQARMDSAVVLCMLAGFYALLRVRENPRWWLLFGAAVGAGVMTKSVVGGLPILIFAIWALVEWDFDWLRETLRQKFFWLGALLAALIALPWHVYETALSGLDFWRSYLGVHVLSRYSENLFQNDVTTSYYFVYLAEYAMPWVVLFAALVILMLSKRRWFTGAAGRIAVVSALSAIAIFAIFGSAETVVVHYLVPLYPLMAITLGIGGALLYERARERWPHQSVQVLCATSAAFFLIVGTIGTALTALHLHEGIAYEHYLANDEREIGRIIAELPDTVPIYFDRPVYWETIRFYANRRSGLAQYDFAVPPQNPYFLVISANALATESAYQALARKHEVLFSGDYAALLFVE